MEIWKRIENAFYEVSNLGNVKSCEHDAPRTNGITYFVRERILKPAKDKKGYLRVGLSIDGKLVTCKVHRLVAIHFLDNSFNLPQVNHINGIKADNRIENLEWVNNSENITHAIKLNLVKVPVCPKEKHAKGSKNGCAKLNEDKVREIRAKFKPRVYTREMLGKEYGVSPSTIKDVILRRWKHV